MQDYALSGVYWVFYFTVLLKERWCSFPSGLTQFVEQTRIHQLFAIRSSLFTILSVCHSERREASHAASVIARHEAISQLRFTF